eukprot:2013646-Pyramimonas_sp.AAC.1
MPSGSSSVCLLAVLVAPRCGGCEMAALRWPRGRDADLARRSLRSGTWLGWHLARTCAAQAL